MSGHLPITDLEFVLANTRQLWDEVRGERIFLTGGTGFFGCWLVESFCYINRHLNLGASITILTRNPQAFSAKCPHLVTDPAVTLLEGDVRTFSFPSGQFSYVIHAATEARARQATSAPLEMLSTIISGTERTLEFATKHGARNASIDESSTIWLPSS